MKRIYYVLMLALTALTMGSCKDMDDNYSQYLEDIPTYAPMVTDLKAVSPEAGSITLSWTLPTGDLAKKMQIVYKESTTLSDTLDIPQLQTSYTITGLKLQQYEFNVYTVDEFGNHSIPVTASFTPIPGRENR